MSCGGYVRTLKWVMRPPKRHHGTENWLGAPGIGAATSSTSQTLVRNPSRQLFSSDRERALFRHWWRVIPDISFPNPRRHAKLLEEQKAMILDFRPILVPMVITCAAGHLASTSGAATETEVLFLKQAAVTAMIQALGLRAGSSPRQDPRARQQQQEQQRQYGTALASSSILDELSALLSASLQLVGIEILRGSDMDTILPLLRGAICLVEQLSTASSSGHFACGLRYDTVIQMETRLLAYHDIITCVPFPRRPLLNRKHWLREDEHLFGAARCFKGEPDMVLGFATNIMVLTGESAAIVDELFHGTLNTELFRTRRMSLMAQLSEAIDSLPPPCLAAEPPTEFLGGLTQEQDRLYNPSIFAARSHAMASQIFLMRAEGLSECPIGVEDIVVDLEASSRNVPVDSPPVTIMLWPLWVLGCETDDSDRGRARRQFVRQTLRTMLAKEGFINIKQCLEMLETHMWNAVAHAGLKEGRQQPSGFTHALSLSSQQTVLRLTEGVNPSSWVQTCYRRSIRPVLA